MGIIPSHQLYEQGREKSDKKSIMLVIGNGFTLNYLNHIGSDLNSSLPLSGFNSKFISSRVSYYYSKIPKIHNVIRRYNKEDNFEMIRDFLHEHSTKEDMMCYLKRFITLAYSSLQLELDKYDNISNWGFYKWIYTNKDSISDIFSLNYDLLIERVLKKANMSYCRPFTEDSYHGYKCHIHKPHGSIDFDLPKWAISSDIESRWTLMTNNNVAENRDGINLRVLDPLEFIIPRVQADIILPETENNQFELRWVNKLLNNLGTRIKKIDKIVIFGFGYRPEDRNEFKKILDLIPKEKSIEFIILGYRQENEKLKEEIDGRNHLYSFIDLEKSSWEEVLQVL